MIVEMFSLFFSFLFNAFNNLYLNTFYCATVNASVRTLAFVGRSCKISVCCLSRVCLFEVDYIRWRVCSLKFYFDKFSNYEEEGRCVLQKKLCWSISERFQKSRRRCKAKKEFGRQGKESRLEILWTDGRNHGGRNYKGRGKGIRDSSTFQMKCPCSISLRLSEDGNQLVVTQLNLSHENHDVGEENYQFYPKVRKLARVWFGGPPSTLNIWCLFLNIWRIFQKLSFWSM